MSLAAVSRLAFAVAALDLWLAILCAATGNAGFAAFMVLAGLMWAYGWHIKGKMDETGE